MNKKVELLSPAGNKEKAIYALNYGADAIFLGAKIFSLRARASNFEYDDIREIVKYAHLLNKKVYLVTNVISHNNLANQFIEFMDKIKDIKIDGFITADPYFIKTLNDAYKNCEIHISTQQSITNSKAALFFKKYNVTRVVLAREMTMNEIKDITNALKDKMEVEIFIHGAVCIAYSGRCMMSNNFSLRDSNVGGCAQSCRWMYKILNNDINHFFTMSAKDMTYVNYIDELIKLGISCFKIEGRMKSLNYITTVTKTYRELIDNIYSKKQFNKSEFYSKLSEVANRSFDDAFLFDANQNKMLYHDVQENPNQDYVFVITKKIDKNTFEIISKNYFDLNMKFKIITPKNEYNIEIEELIDKDGVKLNTVHTPMTKLILKTKIDLDDWEFGIGKRYE